MCISSEEYSRKEEQGGTLHVMVQFEDGARVIHWCHLTSSRFAQDCLCSDEIKRERGGKSSSVLSRELFYTSFNS